MKAKSEETVALREDAEAGNRLAGGTEEMRLDEAEDPVRPRQMIGCGCY